MTEERYQDLMQECGTSLTKEEKEEGWHFCYEYDSLLVGPNMGELSCCRCLPKDHPVYKTIPPEELYDITGLK